MIVICLCALMIALYGLVTRDTVLGFSIRDGQLSGLLFFTNLMLFIIPCIVVIQYVDVYRSPILFYVSEKSIFPANIAILFGIFAFLVFFGVFYRIFVGRVDYLRQDLKLELTNNRSNIIFIFYACCTLLIACVTAAVLGLGAQHAFFEGFRGNNSAGVVRHQNAAINNLSYFKHFVALNCALLSVVIATNVFDGRTWNRLLGAVIIVICGSFYGSKSPLVIYTVIYALSYIESHGQINSTSFIKKIAFSSAICLGVLYGTIYFTYIASNENFDLVEYLFNRVFIAQMAGMYEQWNLDLQSISYGYHSIPFASLFVDYPVFHKDLMMVSESRMDANSIGIKNTFYLAEAYAAFGSIGLGFAPVIMGFSMVINYIVISKLFEYIFANKRLGIFFGSYLFVFFFGLTDGISQSVLLKGSIVVFILFLPLLVLGYIFRTSQSPQRGPSKRRITPLTSGRK